MLLSLVAGIPLVIKALFIAFAFITLQSRERAGDESLMQGIICSLCSFCTEFHGVWNVEQTNRGMERRHIGTHAGGHVWERVGQHWKCQSSINRESWEGPGVTESRGVQSQTLA